MRIGEAESQTHGSGEELYIRTIGTKMKLKNALVTVLEQ